MAQFQTLKNLKQGDFRRFRDVIYDQTGISLDEGKRTLLQSRLQKRLRALDLASYSDYFEYLQDQDPNGNELQEMINRVTTNKTHFFREGHHFDYLRDVICGSLMERAARKERPKQLRIWSAACSSGEEPYSIAITVRDAFKNQTGWDIKILASDIDTNMLNSAASGIYHSEDVQGLDPTCVRENFLKGANSAADKVRIRPELRKLMTFSRINFADEEWPVRTKFDAIFCRNVLIYFDEKTQDNLVRRLANYLQPNGHLFLGHSESLKHTTDVYERVGPTIFRFTDEYRQQSSNSRPPKQPVTKVATTTSKPAPANQSKALPRFGATTANKKPRRLIVGDVFASEEPTVVTTTLGSCIATCLYDEVTRIGGVNHFALPAGESCARTEASYGVHAMELLINEILQLGGAKNRLKAKLFGAAKLSKSDAICIGAKNQKFVHNFLETEGIPVEAEYLGGDTGIQLFFETATGRARIKLLDRDTAVKATAASQKVERPTTDITLF